MTSLIRVRHWLFRVGRAIRDASTRFLDTHERWLWVGTLLLVLAAWATPYQVVNFLRLTSTTAAELLFSTIATSLAAVFGIVVAVLLVALEALRRTFASYAFREFFRSPALRRVFFL